MINIIINAVEYAFKKKREDTVKKSVLYPAILTVLLVATSVSAISVSGTVTDNIETPVADVKVVFTNESDTTKSYETFTGSYGKYSIELPGETVSVGHEEPVSFSLGQNFPNPFNPTTTIPFSVSEAGYINLSIYNILGQKIRILVNSYFSPGVHTVIWNGLAESGSEVSAGIYFYRIAQADQVQTKKMLLLDGGGHTLALSGPSTAGPAHLAKAISISYTVTLSGNHIETSQIIGLTPEDNGIYNFAVKMIGNNMSDNIMYLTIGDTVLEATLADNSSAEALKELLADGPVTINMRDYASMEKVGSLGTSLPRNDEQITTEPGDLILYQGNAFVIYYEPNSWNFTRLGKINDVTQEELKEVLGNGDVEVTLSLGE